MVFEPFGEADFAARPTLAKGYIGPGALGEKKPAGVRYLLDPRVVDGTRWVTGADVDGSHVLDLVAGRDFSGDGVIDVGEVRDGDPCPVCGATDGGILESARGIEMGHIFQLGRKYADALDLQVLDENGKLVTVTMGSYGIGPSRAVAAIAEGTLDELGLCWPRNVAPADVHLVATGKDEEVFAAAERIATELSAAGVEVLYDDRPGKVSPGVKFKDAEMIGVPTIVVVGRDLASDGTVEVRDRASGERENVAAESVVDHVVGSSGPRLDLSRRGSAPSRTRHVVPGARRRRGPGGHMSIESLIQIAGSLLILVPFVLVQLRRMRTDTTAYAALNLVGSAVLAVDALHGHQWGFLLLEGTWAVVSAYALVRRAPAAAH